MYRLFSREIMVKVGRLKSRKTLKKDLSSRRPVRFSGLDLVRACHVFQSDQRF